MARCPVRVARLACAALNAFCSLVSWVWLEARVACSVAWRAACSETAAAAARCADWAAAVSVFSRRAASRAAAAVFDAVTDRRCERPIASTLLFTMKLFNVLWLSSADGFFASSSAPVEPSVSPPM